MFEIISPNVKYIQGIHIPMVDAFENVKLHERGIVEINLVMSSKGFAGDPPGPMLMAGFDNAFEGYEKAGYVYPVSVTGLQSGITESVGSKRFCAWDDGFAGKLTRLIKNTHVLDIVKDVSGVNWHFDSVSKYFRFMRYSKGGEHFPHYDSDFHGSNYVTKYSLVMYFNDCESGELAFVDDPRRPVTESDWERQATGEEIYRKITPRAGRIILFPHTLCHTVLPFRGEASFRRVVRGDLVFTQ